ncbi:MAG TPA: PAS domain S-box protein [Nitrospirota bacterium]|nr:PAS domain S-box protein [Nitrospirota bacterium]
MKDKDKSSQKKRTSSKDATDAKRFGPKGGARRTGIMIEARFQAVFESSRDAIGISKAGIHVFVNPAYLELFGFPLGIVLAGKPVLDLIAPESRDQMKAYILRHVPGEASPSIYHSRGMRTDGTTFDMEVSASLYQEDGEDLTLMILRDITERKRGEEEIAERGAMLQQIMDTASVAIFLVDRSGRIVHANRRMAEMFGCVMEELIGSEYVDHVDPSERESGRQKMLALLASEIPSVDLERLYWSKDGTQFWGHLEGRRFYDIHGDELGLIGVITNITERKRAEEALRESEERLLSVMESVADSIYLMDSKYRFLFMNKKHIERLGLKGEDYIGRAFSEFHSSEETKELIECVDKVFKTGDTIRHEHFSRRDNKYFLRSFSPVKDAGSRIVSVTVVSKDINDLKQMEEKLRNLSITDELTGLHNRRGFFMMVEPLLKLAKRHRTSAYLLYADLDNLKEINDVLGHHEGDRAIIDTAVVLKATFRETDIVARIGGDEFVVIPVAIDKENANIVIARFKENVRAHNEKKERVYKLSISMGMSCYDPDNPRSIHDLLTQAEKLMYEEKVLKQKTS